MQRVEKMGSEAAPTASKPEFVAFGEPTIVHSAAETCFASLITKESEKAPIFECRKPRGETLRVQVATYRGSTFLDIRTYAGTGSDARPTPKGVTIPLDRVRELGDALCRVDLPNVSTGADGLS